MAVAEPKQYLLLNGEPLLVKTLQRLASHSRVNGIVVVISADDKRFPSLDLTEIEAQLSYPVVTVIGGQTRSESVARGAGKITDLFAERELNTGNSAVLPWVMVHDAARPCVRHSDIDLLIEQVDDQGGLLSLEVTDTLWRQDEQLRCVQTLPRDQLRRALTPQLFPLGALQDALASCHKDGFQPTDEAEAMRHAGFRPRLVVGSADNIKVTRAGDMELAALFLQRQAVQERSHNLATDLSRLT
ncbi:MAG: 2-C-methyl-D-erythritol 4-phosphate cytidylyltransferase [Gammaproteobacteria bacterium]|nr:MAG: 2-C-methyl-D-erythritol 4-phosphate cytidylyltransferase [Gammaproteobacteria bacterium]